MTCQECELLLGAEAGASGAEAHLETCAECRALAAELNANAAALEAMRFIEIPPARFRRLHWEIWGVAAAAAIVIALVGGLWMRPALVEKPPLVASSAPALASIAQGVPQPVETPVPRLAPRKNAVLQRSPKTAPLTVKILTDDPDVVIYWLVDGKEGF